MFYSRFIGPLEYNTSHSFVYELLTGVKVSLQNQPVVQVGEHRVLQCYPSLLLQWLEGLCVVMLSEVLEAKADGFLFSVLWERRKQTWAQMRPQIQTTRLELFTQKVLTVPVWAYVCNPKGWHWVPTLLYQLRQGCTTSGSSIPCSSMYQMLKLKLGPQDIRGTEAQRKKRRKKSKSV